MSTENEFQTALQTAIVETLNSEAEITQLFLLPGGASQQMWHLDLTVTGGECRHPRPGRPPTAEWNKRSLRNYTLPTRNI